MPQCYVIRTLPVLLNISPVFTNFSLQGAEVMVVNFSERIEDNNEEASDRDSNQ